MENNKAYLRKSGIIFTVSAIVGIATILITNKVKLSEEPSHILNQVIRLLPILLFFITTGIATEKWKATIGSIVSFVTVIVLQYFLFTIKNHPKMGAGWAFLIQDIFYFIPYFVFFLFIKTEPKKLPVIFFSLLLIFGVTGLYQASEGYEWITDLFSIHFKIPATAWTLTNYIISQLVHVLLMCELLNYAAGKANGFQSRIINPGNDYNKLTGTIIFWTLKTFIYLSVLGCIRMLKSYIGFFSDYYDGSYSFLKWYYLFSFIMTTFILLAAAWYLRKFLLEFFLTYNFSSRFLYWSLLLPVIGFFVWLVMLADSDRQPEYKQRKKTMEDFAGSSPNGIIVIFIIAIALRLLVSFMAGHTGAVFTNLITGLFFWLLVSSRTGYYINLYMNFLLLVAFVMLPFFHIEKDIASIVFPLLLLNTVQLVLIYPTFHFDAFSYTSYDEEEKPWEPGQDIF